MPVPVHISADQQRPEFLVGATALEVGGNRFAVSSKPIFHVQAADALEFIGVSGHDPAYSGSKRVLPRWYGVANFGKFLVQRLHRLEQSDQSSLAHRFNHQTVAVAM